MSGRALRTAALAAGEIRSLSLRGFQLALLLDAVVLIAVLALPAEAAREKAAPRPKRGFDHPAHAAALRAQTGGTEGCAGKCHRLDLEGGWLHERKKEHARCFEGCHRFATSCGTLAGGPGGVCVTCHSNLKERCLPRGAVRAPAGPPTMPARYSHRLHIEPGASGRECEGCHGDVGGKSARGSAARVGHDDCAGCHAKRDSPRMTQCQSCHETGSPGAAPQRPAAANPYAVSGAFSHQKHGAERGVGAAGRACLTCHANIAKAPDDTTIPMPTMRGCLESCHDGKKAFSAVGATCTRCHKGSGTLAPVASAARFSHQEHGRHGVDLGDCGACHALGGDFQVAPPTRGKDHQPCARSGCHADDFLSRGRALCASCHDGREPWVRQEARYRRRPVSEFGSDFSHRSHMEARRAGDSEACRTCHGDRLGGRPPPVGPLAGPPTGVPQANLSRHRRGDLAGPPTGVPQANLSRHRRGDLAGHLACAPCHGKSARPEMSRCGGCHALGGKSGRAAGKPGAWSVAARFRHETHGNDPRSRSGGSRETRCVECHAQVAGAARLGDVAPPTMKSCAGCHDGKHAFKTTGFECARCHGAGPEGGEGGKPEGGAGKEGEKR